MLRFDVGLDTHTTGPFRIYLAVQLRFDVGLDTHTTLSTILSRPLRLRFDVGLDTHTTSQCGRSWGACCGLM